METALLLAVFIFHAALAAILWTLTIIVWIAIGIVMSVWFALAYIFVKSQFK